MRIAIKSMIFVLCTIVAFTSCNGGKKDEKKSDKTTQKTTVNNEEKKGEEAMAFDIKSLPEEPVMIIKTNMGDIKVKLYKDTPLHRDNFVKLAAERFYDGILFHRVIEGFMIQCGDPNTKDPNKGASTYGVGGPGYTIKAEILPQYNHKKGALAAARRADSVNPEKESSGSQFYIVHDPATCAQLDGQYTVFGETLEGLDVIDRIATAQTGARDLPVEKIQIISVRPEMPAAPAADSTATAEKADTASVK